MDDFKRALLEQWARTHNIASNRVSVLFSPLLLAENTMNGNGIYPRNHRHIRSVRVQPTPIDVVDHSQGLLASKPKNGFVSFQDD